MSQKTNATALVESLGSLDSLLRSVTQGRRLRSEDSTEPANESSVFSIPSMLCILVLLAMFYGMCMGSYSIFKPLNLEVAGHADRWLQVIASMNKVPLLYSLTILVTFPSLYVFSALVGTRLNFNSFIRLMITLLAINLAVLASLGPIVAFFSVSTINYRFMQIFNVAMFSIAGGLGLAWLLHIIRDLSGRVIERAEPTTSTDQDTDQQEGITPPNNEQGANEHALNLTEMMPVKWIFRLWIVAFSLVGSQLGWVLRPFIGNPDIAFTWFRERESNFFLAVLDILRNLFS